MKNTHKFIFSLILFASIFVSSTITCSQEKPADKKILRQKLNDLANQAEEVFSERYPVSKDPKEDKEKDDIYKQKLQQIKSEVASLCSSNAEFMAAAIFRLGSDRRQHNHKLAQADKSFETEFLKC